VQVAHTWIGGEKEKQNSLTIVLLMLSVEPAHLEHH